MDAAYQSGTISIPGLTEPKGIDGGAPDICKALAEEDPSRQATMLHAVAGEWFRANSWYYRESAECAAFYAGAHWGFWSEPRGLWVTMPMTRDPDDVRISIPIYKAVIDQATATLVQEDPHFDTMAAKGDARDVAASEAVSSFTSYLWRRLRLGDKYKLSARGVFNAGTSLIYVHWDPNRGPLIATGQQIVVQEPQFDEQGNLIAEPVYEPEMKQQGGLVYDILPPDAFAPDPGSTGEQDGAGVFIRQQMPRSWLYDNFPDAYTKAGDGSPPGVDSDAGSMDSTHIGRWSPVLGQDTIVPGTKSVNDMVWVYTWYGRQTRKHPSGTMRLFSENGVMLAQSDNPVYPTGSEDRSIDVLIHWPVIRCACDDREGVYWGLGRGIAMIAPQKALNGVVSKAVQHAAKIANAKVTMPAGMADVWTDQIGQVLRMPRTAEARNIGYIAPPPMPQEYSILAGQFREYMEYVAGVGAATQGQLPSADTSGIALGRLQQRDMTRIAPVKRSLDASWAIAISLGIRYFRRYTPGAIKVLIAGENKQSAIREFDSSSFGEETDVIAFNNTFLPADPSQRLVFLTQFAQMIGGLGQDPNLQRLVIQLTNLKDANGWLDKLDPDDVKARRQCLRLLNGEDIRPFMLPCDDPLTFKSALEELMKSEEFEEKVRREQMNPMGGGVSPLLDSALGAWNHYTQQAMGPMAAQNQGGIPQPGAPMSPPPDVPPTNAQPAASAPDPMPEVPPLEA